MATPALGLFITKMNYLINWVTVSCVLAVQYLEIVFISKT